MAVINPSADVKKFVMLAMVSGCLFVALMLVRFGVFDYLRSKPKTISVDTLTAAAGRESWLNIFQNKRKIGFAHSRLIPNASGYRLQEDVSMRINTMGMVQEIRLKTKSQLLADMSMADFELSIASGRFDFTARGKVENTKLVLWTSGNGEKEKRAEILIKKRPYLTAGVIGAIGAMQPSPGLTS